MIQSRSDCWSKEIHEKMVRTASKDLWRFIQNNAAERSAEDLFLELTKLSYEDIQKLARIHFLLSNEVQHLVNVVAPSILNRLSKTSINEMHMERGRVNGHIRWDKTYCARAVNGGDPSLFVYSQRSPIFDLPENKVLLYLLYHISRESQKIVDFDLEQNIFEIEEENKLKWTNKIETTSYKISKLLKNPYLKKIGIVHGLTEKLISSAQKARGQWYSELSDTAELYYKFENYTLQYLKIKIHDKILQPLNRDTLYEISVLFKTINTFKNSGWNEKKAGLIGGGHNIVSILEKNGTNIKIYYQGIPESFKNESKYGELMKNYGLSSRLRRPDIVVESSSVEKKRYFIIEVKRSSRREYLVDGAYKILGYLKDFEKTKNNDTDLKGILVGWDKIQNQKYDPESEVYITSWKGIQEILSGMINDIENG